MKKLLDNIISYFDYLERECRLSCTVHFTPESHALLSSVLLTALAPRMSHTHPYCHFVKACGHHPACIQNQRQIHERIRAGEEGFLQTCHGGVCEVIYPVKCDQLPILGYVCATGYREDTPSEGVRVYEGELYGSLRAALPPRRLTDTLLPPLCLMIARLAERTADEAGGEFKQILGYLAENHTHTTLDELAEHFKRSRSHISHLFKANTGLSLRAWCNGLRLADARLLLQSTTLSVTEIAYEVGFEDASYFIKLFREKYGVSPRKMRA